MTHAPSDNKGRAALMKSWFMGYSQLWFFYVGLLLLIPGDNSLPVSIEPACLSADDVDLALDFVPGIWMVKDLLSLGLGINLVTGDPMTDMDTVTLVAWLLFPNAWRLTYRRLSRRRNAIHKTKVLPVQTSTRRFRHKAVVWLERTKSRLAQQPTV